jgi:hypothetical protein
MSCFDGRSEIMDLSPHPFSVVGITNGSMDILGVSEGEPVLEAVE